MIQKLIKQLIACFKRIPAEITRNTDTRDESYNQIIEALHGETQVLQTAISTYIANQAETQKLEFRRFRVESFTLLAVIAYATITLFQWCATRDVVRTAQEANAVSERQARISQRAWVLPGKTDFEQFEVGKIIKIQVESVNTGRTPAVNSTINGGAETFLTNQARPPSHSFDKREPLGKTMIRTEGHPRLTVDSITLTESILNEILSGKRIIRVHGKSWYDDVFGHSHWITFCREYEAFSKGFVTCDVEGEQMDNDPE